MIDPARRPVLVVGGAGFLGSSLASHLAERGQRVRVYDDLSRAGVEANLAWLVGEHGDQIETCVASVLDRDQLRYAAGDACAIFHLAAHGAVATSLAEPHRDFAVNAAGTLELLEAVRALPVRPPLVFASSSKVYGALPELAVRLDAGGAARPGAGARWRPNADHVLAAGVDERWPLAPRTPFGCAKAAAELYVLGYAHAYGLPATVFRLGSVYGPRQLGAEDHGWIAHFVARALDGAPLAIFGDGHQVRDALFVDDLVDALVRAWTQIEAVRGCAFNIGGGPRHALTVLELVELIGRLHGAAPEVRFADWRPDDPRYYVADTSAFTGATGWRPQIAPRAGVEALYGWLAAQPREPR